MNSWRRGYLVLEEGRAFSGALLGEEGRTGEVVFNTSHSGYEEIATDPSYLYQILVMTSPHQGNYGLTPGSWQSHRLWIEGLLVLQMQNSPTCSAWLELLQKHRVPVLQNVDTRKLVVHLREKGSSWGCLVAAEGEKEALQKSQSFLKGISTRSASDWTLEASCPEVVELSGKQSSGALTGVLDFGVKANILACAQRHSSKVLRLPARTTAQEIRSLKLDALILSNGPGDPGQVTGALETIKNLLGEIPMLGICMGHQLLGRAFGGRTFKLKYGHRGGNHPVQHLKSNKIYMTSQNHGYALDPGSLPQEVEVTHLNLNDKTVAGIQCATKKAWGVQFHPEAAPGPREAQKVFDQFYRGL